MIISLSIRLCQALPAAMRARDRDALRALRTTLAALDNAAAVPVDEAVRNGQAVEQASVGVFSTEAPRRELSESDVLQIVRTEVAERLELAARLTAPELAARAAQLQAEAAALTRLLDQQD